jgi:predicted  nucleic acid-binding Zn-ribbon protein
LSDDLKEELQKGSENNGGNMKSELEKLQKQFSELKTMLEQSLSLHDEAARALNQIVELNVMALEQVAMLTQGEGANDQGEVSPTPEQTQMMQTISTFKTEISKVGAKISIERLTVLREISEKLSTLIQSVMGGKKDGKKKDLSKSTEGLVSRVQSLESSVEAVRNESTNKIEAIGKRLNEIENTAGGSSALSDDEEGGDDGKDKSQKSVFSDIIGLDDIKVQISRREAYLNKPKTNP